MDEINSYHGAFWIVVTERGSRGGSLMEVNLKVLV